MSLVVSCLAATLSSWPCRMYVQPQEQGVALLRVGGAPAVLAWSGGGGGVVDTSGQSRSCPQGIVSTLSP